MTTYPPPTATARRVDSTLVRELLGALIVLCGMGLVVGGAFMWRAEAGYITLGLALIAVGMYLGLSR